MSLLSDHVESEPLVGAGHPVLPRVNLLPPEIAEAARFRQVKAGLGGGLLAAVGVVALLYAGAAASVADAEGELATASERTTVLQAETARFAEVEAVYARAAAAEGLLTQAMGEEVRFSRYLNDLSLTVPDRVWLKDVTFAQAPAAVNSPSGTATIGQVTFTGMASGHDDVAVWLDGLAKQKGYADPYFTNSNRTLLGTKPTVAFSSTVSLTSAALSGRYTAPAGG